MKLAHGIIQNCKTSMYAGLLGLVLSIPVQAAETLADRALKDALDDTHSVLLYSPAFAKRFGMSTQFVANLPKGVQAVELEIKKEKYFPKGGAEAFFNKSSFTTEQKAQLNQAIPAFQILYSKKWVPYQYYYDCYFNVYVDDTLTIAFPEEGEIASKAWSDKINKEADIPILANQINSAKWQPAKPQSFTANYDYKAYLLTSKGPVNLSYVNYFKRSVYNITYIHLGPDKYCAGLQQGGKALWIEKKGGADYQPKPGKSLQRLNPADFYQISLPTGLLQASILRKALNDKQVRREVTP